MYFLKLTADQVLVLRLDLGLKSGYYPREEGESTSKGKLSAQINPWRVVDFSSHLFSLHNRLLESP